MGRLYDESKPGNRLYQEKLDNSSSAGDKSYKIALITTIVGSALTIGTLLTPVKTLDSIVEKAFNINMDLDSKTYTVLGMCLTTTGAALYFLRKSALEANKQYKEDIAKLEKEIMNKIY